MIAALAPLVIVGVMMLATLGLVVASRAQRARLRQADAHATADAIARRLGLRFVSGDPYVNLAHPGNGPVDVRLEGAPHGRATTITYRFRTRDATQLSDALIGRDVAAIESVAHVEVACRARRGRFEIRHRARGALDARSVFDPRDPLPRRRFGTDADAHLVVDADDADVPALLAPHLGPLATLGYVHVTGETGYVRFEMGASSLGWQGTASAARYGFGEVDRIVEALAAMAAALEEDASRHAGGPTR